MEDAYCLQEKCTKTGICQNVTKKTTTTMVLYSNYEFCLLVVQHLVSFHLLDYNYYVSAQFFID